MQKRATIERKYNLSPTQMEELLIRKNELKLSRRIMDSLGVACTFVSNRKIYVLLLNSQTKKQVKRLSKVKGLAKIEKIDISFEFENVHECSNLLQH
jgi:hypothetical protein